MRKLAARQVRMPKKSVPRLFVSFTLDSVTTKMSASKLVGTTVGFFLLAFSSLAKCQKVCGVSGLPEFRDTQREGLMNRISAIVPSYTFTCAGVVTRWRVHVERRRNRYDRYDMTLSVWRPADGCTYVRVGENSHSGLAPDLDSNGEALGSVTLDVPKEDRFSVEPGDFVGFSVRHYEVEWPSEHELGEGVASVMVNLNRTDISTYAWTALSLPPILPCIREGIVAINITAAPVITVDMIPVVPTVTTTPSTEDVSHFSSAVPTTTTIEYSYPIVPFPSTTTNPSPVASQTPEHKTAQAVFVGIAAASLLGVAGILSIVCLGYVCIRRQGRKASPANLEPEEQENEYMEIMRSHIYSSNTFPEKRNQGRLEFRSTYDTLTPKPPQPLPTLNPTLSSCSTGGPAFLSHSEAPATSPDSDLLLLSTYPPPSSPTKKQRKESSTSIECPLYSSPTKKAPVVPSEVPEYSSLCSPYEPTYAVPTLPRGTGYENLRCDQPEPPPAYSTENEAEYEIMV